MLYLSSDHGGFRLRQLLAKELAKRSCKLTDLGPFTFDRRDDYPLIARRLANHVSRNASNRGILLCRSGVGVAIAANKCRGIRAVDGIDAWTVRRARRDEDVNVLTLGAEHLSQAMALRLVHVFLTTSFRNSERDRRRIRELHAHE